MRFKFMLYINNLCYISIGGMQEDALLHNSENSLLIRGFRINYE